MIEILPILVGGIAFIYFIYMLIIVILLGITK